ncbi:MAG: ERF family protein [Peptostreptococcaceae bacterium]|nr:ERF family protein [Peptostreptococcaceae bacterium]
MNVYEKLMNIQANLKAPKGQYNSFGKYSYRNAEDILEALKPLLKDYKATVTLKDDLLLIGDRYYLQATATFTDIESGESVIVTSLAREEETKKGYDVSQLTGSTSSYARKYALNGLMLIDNSELDPDSINTFEKESNIQVKSLSEAQINRLYAIAYKAKYDKLKIESMIKSKYKKDIKDLTKLEYDHICNVLEENAK